jgi:hypothetical protein
MKKCVVILSLSLSLLGCQSASKPSPIVKPFPVDPPVAQPVAPATTYTPPPAATNISGANQVEDQAMLKFCLKELDALKKVDAKQYQGKSSELNHLLSEAKTYVQVRNSLNNDMSVILDSAFQYRIAKTCNDIRVDLTQSLLQRIEKR